MALHRLGRSVRRSVTGSSKPIFTLQEAAKMAEKASTFWSRTINLLIYFAIISTPGILLGVYYALFYDPYRQYNECCLLLQIDYGVSCNPDPQHDVGEQFCVQHLQ